MSQSLDRTLLIGLLLFVAASAVGQDTKPESLAFFENNVRPLLIDRCVKCHGPMKAESGLRLDALFSVLQGGDTGPAVVPGQTEQSLIVQAVHHIDGLEMPPNEKLSDTEIMTIERWINEGAHWPEGMTLAEGVPGLRSGPITDHERTFWSFQPIGDPLPPQVDASLTVHNDVDLFIQARLINAGLVMRLPAAKRVLIRRMTFGLTGLPPTPEEVDAFIADDSPDAVMRVVDRLLATQAYGERWGRHWLDVVRYADTAGETADYPVPLAWKYRNWVIDAFNTDKPYNEFIREQIAGDILADQMVANASHPDDEEVLAKYEDLLKATGFIAISRRFGFDVENYHHLTIQDTIDTIGQGVLGLSLGCARCHDHKYDPVNTADYYAWYGILKSTSYSFPGSEEKKRPYDLFPAVPPTMASDRMAEFESRVNELDKGIQELEASKKSAEEKLEVVEQNPDIDRLSDELMQLIAKRDALKAARPYEVIYGAKEQDEPEDAAVQIRGDPLKPGEIVSRRNLEILGNDLLPSDAGSGRREMAEWLTRESNPLTARVMVNRIWQQHFGKGLVATENDFGTRGERPSHPQLLDWLASRFMESGWSVKTMHRFIMASATYQQSSEYDANAIEADPESRLLWRFNRRRLSAEEIRDTMLFVSGDLDPARGREHPFPNIETWGFTQHSPYYGVYVTNQRSVYLMQQRLKRHPFLGLFDGADPNASTARRALTTVPTQALYLMNNEFVHDRAASLTRRVMATSDVPTQQISTAYRLAFGRRPDDDELAESLSFLKEYAGSLDSTVPDHESLAWNALARMILTRNEFLFVD